MVEYVVPSLVHHRGKAVGIDEKHSSLVDLCAATSAGAARSTRKALRITLTITTSGPRSDHWTKCSSCGVC